MYVCYVLVQYAAVCHYRRLCVCVCVCQPPEDGRTYGPKHVGESFFENVFKMLLNVLSINVNW